MASKREGTEGGSFMFDLKLSKGLEFGAEPPRTKLCRVLRGPGNLKRTDKYVLIRRDGNQVVLSIKYANLQLTSGYL